MEKAAKIYLLAYMETIANYQCMGKLKQAKFPNGKYNTLWGSDYLLMDSNSFLGGIGGEQYDTVISMLLEIQ